MFIGALEAGGTRMVCSIGDERGNILQRASFPTQMPEETIGAIADFLGRFGIKALGIGSFGPLDLHPSSPTYGCIMRCPRKEWSGYPLLSRLRSQLSVPCAIDTDVNAAALGESILGAGKGKNSVLYVTVGSGVGGGLILGGRIVHGLVHPEFGHMLMRLPRGETMPDGFCPFHRGCLEGLASGPSIEKRWGLSPRLMMQDHPAWTLEAEYLAEMCVNAVMTVSPEIIILGGGVMQQSHLFPRIRARALELMGGYILSDAVTKENIGKYIVPPGLGVNSGVDGALLLGAQALGRDF